MSIKILRIFVAIFFLVLGITGILTSVDESVFSLNNENLTLEIVFGVVEILCGLVILLNLFSEKNYKSVANASLIVLGFWLARIVLSKFVWGTIPDADSARIYSWALDILTELVIAASIFVLARSHKR
jgi:uncharacterized membrane protein YwaF